MKKISIFIALMITVAMCSPLYAWKFTLTNNIPKNNTQSIYQKMTCDVYGEHFFWRDKVDCTVRDVGKDSSGTCDAGPGICPVALACKATDSEGNIMYMDWKYIGVSCWDVRMEVYVAGNSAIAYVNGAPLNTNWHK